MNFLANANTFGQEQVRTGRRGFGKNTDPNKC